MRKFSCHSLLDFPWECGRINQKECGEDKIVQQKLTICNEANDKSVYSEGETNCKIYSEGGTKMTMEMKLRVYNKGCKETLLNMMLLQDQWLSR